MQGGWPGEPRQVSSSRVELEATRLESALCNCADGRKALACRPDALEARLDPAARMWAAIVVPHAGVRRVEECHAARHVAAQAGALGSAQVGGGVHVAGADHVVQLDVGVPCSQHLQCGPSVWT